MMIRHPHPRHRFRLSIRARLFLSSKVSFFPQNRSKSTAPSSSTTIQSIQSRNNEIDSRVMCPIARLERLSKVHCSLFRSRRMSLQNSAGNTGSFDCSSVSFAGASPRKVMETHLSVIAFNTRSVGQRNARRTIGTDFMHFLSSLRSCLATVSSRLY